MASNRLTLVDIRDGGVRRMEVKTVKATVISMSPFPNAPPNSRVRSEMVLADGQTAIRAFCYRTPTVQEGWTIKLRNYAVRDGRLLFHTRSTAIRCATGEVTPETRQLAERIRITPATPFINIGKVLSTAKNTRVSFRGTISSVEAVREIKNSGGNKSVREINVKDASGCITMSLWGQVANRDLAPAQRLIVTDALAVYSEYHKMMSVSINYDDEIKANQAPEQRIGLLEGVYKNDEGQYTANVVIDDDDYDYRVPEVILFTLLAIDKWDEEDVFSRLPVQVTLKHTNDTITSMNPTVLPGEEVLDINGLVMEDNDGEDEVLQEDEDVVLEDDEEA